MMTENCVAQEANPNTPINLYLVQPGNREAVQSFRTRIATRLLCCVYDIDCVRTYFLSTVPLARQLTAAFIAPAVSAAMPLNLRL